MKHYHYRSGQYVIDRQDHLPWVVRVRDFVLTILIWGVYLYFIQDVVLFTHHAALWLYQGGDFSEYPGLKPLPDIVSFIKMGAGFAAALIGWSYYNMIRYGKKQRRKTSPPLEIEQLAHDFHVDPHDLKHWQKQRILVMHHDGHGRLVKVTDHQ